MKTHLSVVLIFLLGGPTFAAEPAALEVVQQVERAGLPTGLVLTLGQTDLKPAEALARTGRYLVHQLVPADRVDGLRRAALEAGVHGRLVIDALPGGKLLPHPDRFIDLIILNATHLDDGELHRVLNVGGKLLVHREGAWRIVDRLPEKDIDFWTHKWHGPSGQVLSLDRKAGPPTTVQWAAGPSFADGAIGGKHPVIGAGSFVAVDSVDGAVQVRSAGSGLPRWRSEFGLSAQAELLIDGDRLICRPPEAKGPLKGRGEAGPLAAFQLLTGVKVQTYGEAPQITAIPGAKIKPAFPSTLALGDKLVAAAGPELAILERATGKRLWSRKLEQGVWFAPVVLEGAVIACENASDPPPNRGRIDHGPAAVAVAAFELADGKPRWRVEVEAKAPPMLPLVAAEGLVFLHTTSYQSRQPGAYIAALDVKTGKQLWRQELPDGTKALWSSTDSASRIICREGTLYYVGGHSLGSVAAWNARTGQVIHDAQRRPKFVAYGGECSGSLATVNWLIMSGVTWWDREYKPVNQPAARSACGTGVFPAQGMVFTNPTGCDCTQYMRGYLGLGCAPLPSPVAEKDRLVRGPGKALQVPDDPTAWPTLLGNPQRNGATGRPLPEKLRELWRIAAAPAAIPGALLDDRRRDEYWNGALTAPVASGEIVVVGLSDAQAVVAIDAATGKVRWRTPLGGPVNTPPTLYRGLCLVGSQDGWVHALSLDDGRPVWQFLAAPSVRPAMLHGRLASAFPVPGSVLVLNDTVLATAGSHSYLGGIHAWALEPLTGKVLGRSVIRGAETPTQSGMVFNDVLSAGLDGKDAWMFRHFRLGLDAQQLPVPPRAAGTHFPGVTATAVVMDRRAATVRFPHNLRGGSTHGWKSKMSSGPINAFRIVRDGDIAYALDDPTDELRQFNKGIFLWAQPANAVRLDQKAEPLWTRKPEDLGTKESYTAIIKAGDRLYVGGGKRDGTAGFVQVVAAADGSLLQQFDLPAQVAPCGLAACNGRLVVSCVDGSVAAFGK